jgi:hypothetical protein
MSDEIPVSMTYEEISLLLQWMYRASASGLAASHMIKKLQDAKSLLKPIKDN